MHYLTSVYFGEQRIFNDFFKRLDKLGMEACYIKLVNKGYVYGYGEMNTYTVSFRKKNNITKIL